MTPMIGQQIHSSRSGSRNHLIACRWRFMGRYHVLMPPVVEAHLGLTDEEKVGLGCRA